MTFQRLPTNSEKLLLEVVNAEKPVQLLCELFEGAAPKEDAELRGIIRELCQEGYMNVKWASHRPYIVTLNNSARTYGEQLAEYEAQKVVCHLQEKKVNPIIFISHRSTDKVIANMIVDFFTGTGIPRDKVFCSSLPGNDINEKISAEVKTALKCSVVNIAILSHDYYQSAYCLNEAGVLWYEDVPVIPIALPEISSNNMFGFLNSEYKLRRLDSDTDISYIYDTVSEAVSAPRTKVGIITQENNKLRTRYTEYINIRPPSLSTPVAVTATSFDEITTDDERVVLYYMLHKNVRKASKTTIREWLNKSEIYGIDIDNAFDLLSSLEGGTIAGEALELGINVFRKYSATTAVLLPKLKEYVDQHTKLASDTFGAIWESGSLDSTLVLFIAYIVDERMHTFGNRWMADSQIQSIKQWEQKNLLDSTLSNNYGSCLEFFVQNDLMFESSWTSYGNPREYSLCTSLQELLFQHPLPYLDELAKCKQSHEYILPF